MKKMAAILAGLMIMAAGSAWALPTSPSAPAQTGSLDGGPGSDTNPIYMQQIFNNITLAGQGTTSNVNAYSGFVAEGRDAYWSIGGTGGSLSTMVIEIAGLKDVNSFGIYDATSPGKKITLFDGRDSTSKQSLIGILDDGTVELNFGDTGVKFAGNNFGYFLFNGTDYFYSDSKLNPDNTSEMMYDHMFAYQGKGNQKVKIGKHAAGTWGLDEYILGFEDVKGPNTDFDFNDMVVMVESVNPTVPEPGTIVLLGAGLLGLGFFGRRRVQK